MAKEYINGQLFINGYATDEAGRPRTVVNGYTDEDEQDAILQYQLALESKTSPQQIGVNAHPAKQKKQSDKKSKKDFEIKKYCTKYFFESVQKPNNLQLKKTYSINGEEWQIEFFDNRFFVGGYATNDMGQPICAETGYDDQATQQSALLYKQAKAKCNVVERNYFF